MAPSRGCFIIHFVDSHAFLFDRYSVDTLAARLVMTTMRSIGQDNVRRRSRPDCALTSHDGSPMPDGCMFIKVKRLLAVCSVKQDFDQSDRQFRSPTVSVHCQRPHTVSSVSRLKEIQAIPWVLFTTSVEAYRLRILGAQ